MKELENYLWDIELYFKAVHTPEGDQVTITNMNLFDDTKLCWKTKLEEDVAMEHLLTTV